jgi:uroporphyrinogen decarboxylase
LTDAAPSNSLSGKPLLRVLNGEALSPPPIWLMRQAGRYLPEYREIRAKFPSFLDFCYAPKAASEATLQPIRRFGFDAAILFSDILVVPDALGQKVAFEVNEGPRLEPIASAQDFGRLAETIDLTRLAPVFETIERVKAELPASTTLIGFCGAPWTVASYMIAGRGTPDQAPARLFAYREPELFQRLIDRLVAASIDYLARQFEAGVEAVQIFDSWAGVLPPGEYERWCLAPIKAIVAGLRARRRDAKVIGFPKGIGPRLDDFAAATGVDAVGLDSAVDPVWAARNLPGARALQGNLDPLALLAGGAALEAATARILEAFRGWPHIFNLGHGVPQQTPPAHVEALMKLVRAAP